MMLMFILKDKINAQQTKKVHVCVRIVDVLDKSTRKIEQRTTTKKKRRVEKIRGLKRSKYLCPLLQQLACVCALMHVGPINALDKLSERLPN